jgi:hypothetical protein
MKKQYGLLLVGMCGVYLVAQEFIKSPKVKKVYVSCQQYLELSGEVTMSTNTFWGLCADLLQNAFAVQNGSLSTIHLHIDGEKDCFLQQADKVERTDKYAKLMRIKQEFDRCNDELRTMKQRLDGLMADFSLPSV